MPVTTHRYGDHPDQFAQLTLPDADPPAAGFPVAAVVHGGFWLAENTMDRMEALCADLASRGWAAWNVEYRRLGADSGGGYPQTPQDVAAAIDHLATLTDAPLDLARVVSIGHSAGAQLILLDAARTDATVRVAGLVAQAPLTDVGLAHDMRRGIDILEAFMGGGPAQLPDVYAEASPVARVPLGVPQLVVQGGRDEMVSPQMVVDYVEAAQKAGDDVTIELRADDGHFEHLDPTTDAWVAVPAWLARFTR